MIKAPAPCAPVHDPEPCVYHAQPHVGVAAGTATWLGARDYKRLMTWMPYTANILVLTRDRGSGRVTIGKDGLPRVAYWPNAFDRANMLKARAAPDLNISDQGRLKLLLLCEGLWRGLLEAQGRRVSPDPACFSRLEISHVVQCCAL